MFKAFATPEELLKFMDENGFEQTKISECYVMACCPFHNDHNPSFGIHYQTLDCHCFYCGWFDIEAVCEKMGIPLESISDTIDAMSHSKWGWITKAFTFRKQEDTFTRYQMPLSKPIANCSRQMEYMLKRGFTPAVSGAFGLRVASDVKYKGRILIPINDEKGKIMFFDARSIGSERHFKYLRPNHSPVSRSLFGIDRIRHNQYVCITEGVLSALRLWQWNIQAVALCGSYIHLQQLIMLLVRGFKNYIIATDNDNRGNRAAHEISDRLLNTSSNIQRMKLPTGGDPADIKTYTHFLRLNSHLNIGENNC